MYEDISKVVVADKLFLGLNLLAGLVCRSFCLIWDSVGCSRSFDLSSLFELDVELLAFDVDDEEAFKNGNDDTEEVTLFDDDDLRSFIEFKLFEVSFLDTFSGSVSDDDMDLGFRLSRHKLFFFTKLKNTLFEGVIK